MKRLTPRDVEKTNARYPRISKVKVCAIVALLIGLVTIFGARYPASAEKTKAKKKAFGRNMAFLLPASTSNLSQGK
ncbi:MAG: hypothetical protein LW850_24800 [Planctomycetaceae bacterium]|nr:hypothetical protein [Planctomycetaceae bacterium]